MNDLKHLAIIMDGNGRWAERQEKHRSNGHEQGAKNVRIITEYCAKIGVEYLTLYAFSTENWKRPKLEVEFLMKLLDRYLKKELETYQKNNVEFKAIGNLDAFTAKLQNRIKITEDATKGNSDLTHVLALNYGGRAEITGAVNKLIAEGKTVIEEKDISAALQTPYSDIDLLVRTSGEERISNYLLWQISYAEFHFTETLWPDFTTNELDEIVQDFEQRTRRFGGLK